MNYQDDLPQIAVVFIFVNEALSVILRSVHSVVNHTPSHLLKEIILVDDNSDNGKFLLQIVTHLPFIIYKLVPSGCITKIVIRCFRIESAELLLKNKIACFNLQS